MVLRTAVDLLEGLLYKLRMMGVKIDGPTRIFCDNQSVVMTVGFPEISLKKKNCSIAFHRVREAVASRKILVYYEELIFNIADLFTKVLGAEKRSQLVKCVLS